MKSIGKSKITRLRAKKDIEYPLIRLPRSHANLAGETAHIYEINHDGKPLFVISLDDDFDADIKVVQQKDNSSLKSRVDELEDQLNSLQKSLSENDATAGIRTRVLSLGSSGHSH